MLPLNRVHLEICHARKEFFKAGRAPPKQPQNTSLHEQCLRTLSSLSTGRGLSNPFYCRHFIYQKQATSRCTKLTQERNRLCKVQLYFD
jgi:hypothetical protein